MHYQIYNTKWLVLFKKNYLTLTVALFSLILITEMVRSTSTTTILVRNENEMLIIAVVCLGKHNNAKPHAPSPYLNKEIP